MRPDGNAQRASERGISALLKRLRTEHPHAQIMTELVRLDDAIAVVRASIVVPDGGSSTGFGATSSGGPEAVETAEVRALERALAVLGFGTVGEPLPAQADAPVERQDEVISQAPAERPAPAPVRSSPPQAAPPSTPTAPVVPPPSPAGQQPALQEDDPPLEDYSWTEFWKWARARELQNKAMVEELIGQSITSLSPAQVRKLLREKTGVQ